ncbi:MAG: TenA family protein [Pseudonocardia sp.]|nr:TenA family protein [Pseudonocardia sp.]
MTPGTAARLRERFGATWDAAVRHRFVHELWDGSLDRDVLARYLVQDFQFCDAFLALMGAAVATCDDPAARVTHARQVGLVAGDEHEFFHSSFDALGVSVADRTSPSRAAPTTGFVALMDRARTSGDHASCLAVLLVAEWLYLDWATRPSSPAPVDPILREWIDLHRGPDFETWVAFLRAEFDRTAAALDPPVAQRVSELFGEAVALELAFFEAAYA